MHFGSHIPMDTMDSIPVYLPDNTLCLTDTSDWYRYSGQNNPGIQLNSMPGGRAICTRSKINC